MKNNQVIESFLFLEETEKNLHIVFSGKNAIIRSDTLTAKISIDDRVVSPVTYFYEQHEIVDGGDDSFPEQKVKDNHFFIMKKEIVDAIEKLNIPDKSKKKITAKFFVNGFGRAKFRIYRDKEIFYEKDLNILNKGRTGTIKICSKSQTEVNLLRLHNIVNTFDCGIIGIQFQNQSPLVIFNRRLKRAFMIENIVA